jgi:hypothetical protein
MSLAIIFFGLGLGFLYLSFSKSRVIREKKTLMFLISRAFILPLILLFLGYIGTIAASTIDPSYASGCGSQKPGACFGLGIVLAMLMLASVPSTILSLVLYFISTKKKLSDVA